MNSHDEQDSESSSDSCLLLHLTIDIYLHRPTLCKYQNLKVQRQCALYGNLCEVCAEVPSYYAGIHHCFPPGDYHRHRRLPDSSIWGQICHPRPSSPQQHPVQQPMLQRGIVITELTVQQAGTKCHQRTRDSYLQRTVAPLMYPISGRLMTGPVAWCQQMAS